MVTNNLSQLNIGDYAEIVSVGFILDSCRQRLLALGLFPGAKIKFARVAPLGDPLMITKSDGTSLSVRKADATRVTIKKIGVDNTEWNQ